MALGPAPSLALYPVIMRGLGGHNGSDPDCAGGEGSRSLFGILLKPLTGGAAGAFVSELLLWWLRPTTVVVS